MTQDVVESPLERVARFLGARDGAYCPDCIRIRLSLGRGFTSAQLMKGAAAAGLVHEKPALCDCCRRSRTVLRASARVA